jgi:hypothetical protein
VTQVLQELAELQAGKKKFFVKNYYKFFAIYLREQKYVLWMYPSAQPSLQELRMEKSAM